MGAGRSPVRLAEERHRPRDQERACCCRRRSSTLSAKVNTFDDRGFWGLAFHPNFASNGYVYMTYVFEERRQSQRPVRQDLAPDPRHGEPSEPGRGAARQRGRRSSAAIGTPPAARSLPAPTASRRTVAVTPSARCASRPTARSSSATAMAPTQHSPTRSLRAQDLDSYSGKILRINDDGTAPSDNPFYDGTNSDPLEGLAVRRPESLPLRHPPGQRRHLLRRRRLEHLGRGQSRSQRGANYGWPCYEGAGLQPGFQSFAQCQQLSAGAVKPPVYTYDRSCRCRRDRRHLLHGKPLPRRIPRQLLLRRLLGQLDPARRRRCAAATR